MDKAISSSPRNIVFIGLVSLAIAMGVGRFAFTPLMPLMLRDGSINGNSGAEWAAANYVGYLLGALTASVFRHTPRRGMMIGLVGVVCSTVGMFGVDLSTPWTGEALRCAAGISSAWVLVCTSSWCLPELARQHASSAASWVYSGVGLGIAATGLIIWLGGTQAASQLWLVLGAVAALGVAGVCYGLAFCIPRTEHKRLVANLHDDDSSHQHRSPGLVFSYGAFGFAYSVPATFLPSMARQQVADPQIFGLAWPVFGIAAAFGVAIVSRCFSSHPRHKVWSAAHLLMALGTVLPLLKQSFGVISLCAVLVGGTFMIATMAGLQLARECMPANPAPLLVRMTVSFSIGQIAGPLLIRVLGDTQLAGWHAMDLANASATVLLLGTAIYLWPYR